jgi:FdhD protein
MKPSDDSTPTKPEKRGGRMSGQAAVEEVPVWLEVNGAPAVTWMCTPDLLEELAVGWLAGEGYVETLDDVRLRPCATDLGFWAEIAPDRVARVRAESRRPVLASGCGAVSIFLAEPDTIRPVTVRGEPPPLERLRPLFKELFGRGERYRDTGGIHAAALTDGAGLLAHAEDIGRHNAVDKVIGAMVLARRPVAGLGLMVTGRISAELAAKAARAGIAWVATPSVPSTLAVEIARRTGMVLVGRAVSGEPHLHGGQGGQGGQGGPIDVGTA